MFPFSYPADDRWLLPEGIEELLPEEAERLELLRRKVLDRFAAWGYRLVMPPLIEFIDSLLTGVGHDLDIQTFKLIDQASGRLLGIRADMTPQVARIDARTHAGDMPGRFCYLGSVLHTQADRLEKSRSPIQFGAELYGHGGRASDLEIIRLMLEVLTTAGVEQIHLDLGHVGIFRGLARQAGLTGEQEGELFSLLQQKARPELTAAVASMDIAPRLARMFTDLVDLNGRQGVIERARECLSEANAAVHLALEEMAMLAERLGECCPEVPVNFDLAELRGYRYQTGVVFAAFVPGYGREVARGGRYDDIGKVFGRARPATGFSADLKVILRLSGLGESFSGSGEGIFAPAASEPALIAAIRELRDAGRTVIEALPGQQGDAAAHGFRSELRFDGERWRVCPVVAKNT